MAQKGQGNIYEVVAAFIIFVFIFGKPELAHALADMAEWFYMAVALVFVAAIPVSVIQGVFQQKKSK